MGLYDKYCNFIESMVENVLLSSVVKTIELNDIVAKKIGVDVLKKLMEHEKKQQQYEKEHPYRASAKRIIKKTFMNLTGDVTGRYMHKDDK
uniref:hypothetical protein n=1 Tax=Candidatus Electronema sp. TaxID=2698783 RepID=UPI0040577C85